MNWLNNKNIRLLAVFVSQDIRGRYVGSTMGIFWNIINPLVLLTLYTFIFQVLMKMKSTDHPSYAAYIFCGLLPWMAVSESLLRSTGSIIENANLVRKVVFPKEILVLYIVASSFIHELISMGLFLILLVILGTPPTSVTFLIIIVFFAQFIFSIGAGFFLSTLHIFIRDTLPLLQAFMTVWFFMTPIIYPIEQIPDNLKKYFLINPMFFLVKMYRTLFLKNQVIDFGELAIFSAEAIIMFILGIIYFQKNKHVFSDYL